MKTYKLKNKSRFFKAGLLDMTGYNIKIVSNKTRIKTSLLHKFISDKLLLDRWIPEETIYDLK